MLSSTTVETDTSKITIDETSVFSGDSDGSTMVDEERDDRIVIYPNGFTPVTGSRDMAG